MSYADLMQAMADDGAPLAAIIRAVRALEAKDAEAAEKRAQSAERKRRQRGRERDSHVTVMGQSQGQLNDPPLDKETSPIPPKEINHPRNNNPARVRGTRLDVQWRPEPLSGEAGEKVAEHGQKWAKIQFEAFQNHWLAKSGRDACKLDWQRTWANWIINANPPKAAFGQPPPQSMDNKLIELRRRYGTQ